MIRNLIAKVAALVMPVAVIAHEQGTPVFVNFDDARYEGVLASAAYEGDRAAHVTITDASTGEQWTGMVAAAAVELIAEWDHTEFITHVTWDEFTQMITDGLPVWEMNFGFDDVPF